jgi:hypothetical protein
MAWRMMLLMMTSKQCRFWYIRSFGLWRWFPRTSQPGV